MIGHPDYLPEAGHATGCDVGFHRPAVMRFVWHHLQPKVCGGNTVPENLVSLCDSCHITVHVLMWHLGKGTPPPAKGTRMQRKLAKAGYEACLSAGTVDKIPKEGSA